MDKSDIFMFLIFLFLMSITLIFSQGRREMAYPFAVKETTSAYPMPLSDHKDGEDLMIWIDFNSGSR